MATGQGERKLLIQNQTWGGMDSARLFLPKTCPMTKVDYEMSFSFIYTHTHTLADDLQMF